MKSILERKGINATAVAEQYGVDRHTVISHYKQIINQNSKVPRKERTCYLKNIIKEYENLILDPRIKLKATYMYIINIHPVCDVGTYSNFVQYVRNHYKEERKIRRMGLKHYRYETAPGDLLQFDWIEDLKIELSTGEIVKFDLWSGTLAYSRFHYFKAVTEKTTESVIRCLIENMISIEGRPMRVMTDNMSAIVTIRNGERYVSPVIKQFLKDMNIELVLCKPRHPYTKGKVEVSNKYQEWIKPYNKKFATIDEALQIIPLVMMQCNSQINSETNLAPIKLFNKNERNALKDLPDFNLFRYYYKIFYSTKVNNAGLIKYDGASYGVPDSNIGEEVYVSDQGVLIEIFNKYMERLVTYTKHKYGIHYLKSMYEFMREHLPKWMTQEQYEKMLCENLNLLAALGGIEDE